MKGCFSVSNPSGLCQDIQKGFEQAVVFRNNAQTVSQDFFFKMLPAVMKYPHLLKHIQQQMPAESVQFMPCTLPVAPFLLFQRRRLDAGYSGMDERRKILRIECKTMGSIDPGAFQQMGFGL